MSDAESARARGHAIGRTGSDMAMVLCHTSAMPRAEDHSSGTFHKQKVSFIFPADEEDDLLTIDLGSISHIDVATVPETKIDRPSTPQPAMFNPLSAVVHKAPSALPLHTPRMKNIR